MTRPLPPCIGLWSPAPGSGKSSVAAILEQHYPRFSRIPFAQPLRLMLRPFLIAAGYSPEEADHLLNTSAGKSTPLDRIPGNLTPRHLLQTLGTEWGRGLQHPDIWVAIWMSRARCCTGVIADDVRFNSEALAIRALGGQIWAITRPGHSIPQHVLSHASEAGIDPTFIDLVLENDGDLLDLEMKVINAIAGVEVAA